MYGRIASIVLFAALVHAAPPPPKDAIKAPPTITLKPVMKGKAPAHKYTPDQIARGEILVRQGGCNDCHTPMTFDPKHGMQMPEITRLFSGHPEGAPDPATKLAPGD